MINPTIAHIDLSALQHNVKQIKSLSPNSKILAMVKSNAYGHGAVEVAKALVDDVAAFGVIFLKEAQKIFAANVKKKIVILSGFFDAEELRQIDACGFDTVIHNHEQLRILEQIKLEHPLNVWLKIDTGMHRLGFQPHEIPAVYAKLMQHPKINIPLQLMTHFSDADDLTKSKTQEQFACFQQVATHVPGAHCLANSSAILNWPQISSEWIRPGIMLYGAMPFFGKINADLKLKPVMTLTSRIIAVHQLHQGDAVGYGSSWICPEDMRVGIIAVGYGDGYPRNTIAGTPILINGIRASLIGRVAMDLTTVDLRLVPEAQVGTTVTLWGKGLPIELVAQGSGSIPYEVLCRLTSRVFYQYEC